MSFAISGSPPRRRSILLIRADLLIQLRGDLPRGVTAATILRVTQPRVSDLLRGRLFLFSTDTLINLLAPLNARMRFVLKFPGVD